MPAFFFTTEELIAFVEAVRADLDAAGHPESARRLAVVHDAYTTGAEWLGALHQAVAEIRRERGLPRELDARLTRLLEPPYAERLSRRQSWEVVFRAAAAVMLIGAVAALGLLAAGNGEGDAPAVLAVVAGAVAMLWIALRKISVCAGCGWRSQRPALAWCPFCGMRRYSGTPGPRLRPVPETPPSAAAVCPSCGKPPGGRSRYGRPYPSEGQFCGYCGTLLP